MPKAPIVCRPRVLTPAQAEVAVRRSVDANPANALESRSVARTPVGRRGGPMRLAVLVGHKWPASGVRLSVQFLDTPPQDLRKRILLHMNAWNQNANVLFTETQGTGQVRIARLDRPADMAGYWSFVGTQILAIEEDQPTFNLEGFTMKTTEAEFRRVVRHEAGHTLGFEHEHMRAELVRKIDRKKAIAFFDRDQGWTAEETEQQVLTPLSKTSILGTAESDPTSIMCYQIPGAITKDGKTIKGGRDINRKDFTFAASIYPKRAAVPESSVEALAASGLARAGAPLAAPVAALPAGVTVGAPGEDFDTFHIVVMDAIDTAPARGRTRRGAAAGEGDREDAESARPRFARLFATYGGARVTARMRLRAVGPEAPTRFGNIIGVHERIKKYTNREAGTLPTDPEMLAFGGSLFETLFEGEVRRLYDEARSRQGSRRLDLVFTSMIPWIAEKPWEFAYDAARERFLATEEIHFIRNVLTAIPTDAIAPHPGPLRMLVTSAQPIAFGRLSIEQETEVIRRGFAPLIEAGLAQVDILPRATPGALHGRLSTGDYNIVHFIGHGGFDERTGSGFLVFEDSRGGEVLLPERSVREIFCQRGVSLVFLNACQSGTGGRADFNKGVAQSLVARGLPALVANQYSVLDSSATSFAQHFYWSLGQGLSLGQAAREARIAVNYSLQGSSIDWAVPVVYARDPCMVLAARPAKLAPFPATTVVAAARQVTRGRPLRVAVWDIDQVFPTLEQILARMNAAQTTFGFEVAAISAPLDVWDLEPRAPDGGPYLRSEKLASRLASKPAELGADILACVTRHWLRDEDWLNIYGWWPDGRTPPVLIFSCAGFEDLPAAGPLTDRAVANLTVTGLAGFLAAQGTHEKGAQDCPLAFNRGRQLRHLVGRQAFDKRCRATLKRKIPDELAGLEALLGAFD